METTVITVGSHVHYYCRTFNWYHNPFFALRN